MALKYTFSQPEHAASLLRDNLPTAIAERIDWTSFERLPESFVDEELAWRFTDLLFRAKLSGRDAYIYVLIEHQSTSDPLMALRFLVYLSRVWERVIKDNKDAKVIPAIIPQVIYHGKRKWNVPKTFLDIVDLDDQTKQIVAPFVPNFSYLLDDLRGLSDQEIRARAISPLAVLTLLCLKNMPGNPNPINELRRLIDLISEVTNAGSGLKAFEAVICYTYKVADPDPQAFKEMLEVELGGRIMESYMTTYERIVEEARKTVLSEGIAKGRVEGEAKGRAEVVRKLLTVKFGPLPTEMQDRLQKASVPELDLWAERVLTAQKIQDIFN